MRIVFSIGGRALIRDDEVPSAIVRDRNIRQAAQVLAPLCAAGHEIVITHDDGPHAGLLAIQAVATPDTPYPLDALDRANAGMAGHLIRRHLTSLLPEGMMTATLLTQVRVDRGDPAFRKPERPTGETYSESEARALAAERGWRVASDAGGWRRVVAAPRPLEILEASVIRMLIERKVVVICTGCFPVVELADGRFSGVEAVIDRDDASALLACQLDADWLVMLTDVDALYRNWGGAGVSAFRQTTPGQLSGHRFAAGSMGPKVNAACDFVARTGKYAGIGALADAGAILAGLAGTIVAIDLVS
jgi:carbamate kinase